MMKSMANWVRALGLFVLASVACGIVYTAAVTLVAQVVFPYQANGSFVEGTDGNRYSMLVGQTYRDDAHMWGRVQNYNAETFTDEDGSVLLWAGPTNESPAAFEFGDAVAQRVEKVRAAHPEQGDAPVPSDLVTCSGSGFDPHISPAAAEYQVERLARTTGRSQDEIRAIIVQCTQQPQFGVLGDAAVNVLAVNLMLDGVL
ncbi:MAG: potassium-transporting ATPase subunit C [Slackia faecicanis]|nr:potassium-transporting ATPase subunit C [Slackia faecicanis]